MLQGIGQIIEVARMLLPAWAFPILIGIVALIALPAWLNSMRSKQIRGVLRRMVRADAREKDDLRAEALALTADKPIRLHALAMEAKKRGYKELFDLALARLETQGKLLGEVKKLRAEVYPEPKRGGHPMEEAVIIERLIDEGMTDQARVRLEEALERFPDNTDLRAIVGHFEGDVHEP